MAELPLHPHRKMLFRFIIMEIYYYEATPPATRCIRADNNRFARNIRIDSDVDLPDNNSQNVHHCCHGSLAFLFARECVATCPLYAYKIFILVYLQHCYKTCEIRKGCQMCLIFLFYYYYYCLELPGQRISFCIIIISSSGITMIVIILYISYSLNWMLYQWPLLLTCYVGYV